MRTEQEQMERCLPDIITKSIVNKNQAVVDGSCRFGLEPEGGDLQQPFIVNSENGSRMWVMEYFNS